MVRFINRLIALQPNTSLRTNVLDKVQMQQLRGGSSSVDGKDKQEEPEDE
ncbi:MAG: hypothetical protein AAFX87_17165 [Bacteroidota bacterium]